MRLPKRGEKARLPKSRRDGEQGFTLIELLIVVAILGVLAAVVIPNVSRFIGRGETEAAKTELANIQSAVVSMMTDNNIGTLDNPVDDATDNMSAFPSPGTDNETDYILYGFFNASENITINYVATEQTANTYTVDALGTVTQH